MKVDDRKIWLAAALAAAAACVRPGLAAAQAPEALESADWAGAMSPAFVLAKNAARAAAAQAQSLPNFAQVSPALFRSGQPTQQGVDELAAKGVKTILKFNTEDPAEADWAAAAGVGFDSQVMSGKSLPTYAQVDAALAVIQDPASQPVLVHCEKGADRTGTVVAAYRVVVQGMSVAQAVAEAKSFGYGDPGFTDLTTWLNGYVAYRAAR